MAPLISHVYELGLMDAVAMCQLDLAAYDAFLGGIMVDHELSDASIQAALETVPRI